MVQSDTRHDVFQAIADPTRRALLQLLVNRELPIVTIASQFPISRTAINKHLAILSDAGLVLRQKVGREMRFSLQAKPLAEVQSWLSFFESYWDDKLQALTEFVEGPNRSKSPS